MRKHSLRSVARLLHLRGWRQWLSLLSSGLVLVALVIVGLFFRYAEIGKYLLLGYGILAIVLRIKSSTTFKMMLVVLICMPILSMRGDDELVATLSIYAFLLLGIGTVSLLIEQIISGKKYI